MKQIVEGFRRMVEPAKTRSEEIAREIVRGRTGHYGPTWMQEDGRTIEVEVGATRVKVWGDQEFCGVRTRRRVEDQLRTGTAGWRTKTAATPAERAERARRDVFFTAGLWGQWVDENERRAQAGWEIRWLRLPSPSAIAVAYITEEGFGALGATEGNSLNEKGMAISQRRTNGNPIATVENTTRESWANHQTASWRILLAYQVGYLMQADEQSKECQEWLRKVEATPRVENPDPRWVTENLMTEFLEKTPHPLWPSSEYVAKDDPSRTDKKLRQQVWR